MMLLNCFKRATRPSLLQCFLGIALLTTSLILLPGTPAQAANNGVLLNGWGCYSGCTKDINGQSYTVYDSGYQHNPAQAGDSKNWTSIVDWFGDPTPIYPTNKIDDQPVPCTTAGGYPGTQLHGVSSWTDPDGTILTQDTWGICMGNSPPVVTLSCPPTEQAGNLVWCGVSVSDSEGDSYTTSWGGGSGFNSGPYSTAGDVTITASATDSKGATGSDSKTVTILVTNHDPSVTVTCPSTVAVDASGKGTFSCTATGTDTDVGDTVTVSMGGSTGPGSVTTSFAYAPGTYTISASASDGKGGTASGSASVTVTGSSGSPTATVSCSPSTIPADGKTTTTCTASASGGTPPYTYDWGASSKAFGPHTTPGTQTVTVTVTDSLGKSGGASTSYTVSLGSLVVSVSCSPNNITSPPGSSTCSSSVSGGTGSYTYTWSNGGTGASSTYTGISSATTANLNVRDSAGATGSGSAAITVNGSSTTCPPGYIALPGGGCKPPCSPDPDYRSMSTTATPTLVRAGVGYTTIVMSTSGSVSSRTATASWGDTQTFQNIDGTWQATFFPPRGLSGKYTIQSSAQISQADGCGGIYGPSPFSDTESIDIYQITSTTQDTEAPPVDDMTVANMPLQQYLQVCLGSLEPWYCGIDVRLATVYMPDLQQRQEAYLAELGPTKWRLLVKRINDALTAAGYPPSELYIPSE